MKKYQLTLIASFILFAVSAQQKNYISIEPGESEKDIILKAANIIPSPRQLRWQQLELTAFFHFGVNTFTGREWGTGKEAPAIFNPSALDARQWVRIAKEAGIKQVILTAKHHDGFCLWPTKTTTHSVAASPWKNGKGDLVKEVSKACKEMNVGFGIYLSPWDMNSPYYGNNEKYNEFFMSQLSELLTGYGKVDEVWFDGAKGEGVNQEYYFDKWYQLIRQLQPQAVIAIMGPDVRWVGTETGYGRVTEWSVVPVDNLTQTTIAAGSQKDIVFKPQADMRGDDLGSREKIRKAKGLVWYPAETDVSIRPGWFYHEAEDSKVKSPEKLLDIYFNSVGRNGVLLLNIPPDKRGLIHASDSIALKQWKQLQNDIFNNNLAKGSRIKSPNGVNTKYILDGNNATHFTTKGNDTATVIELQLKSPASFNVLQLQENIRMGQRIELFEFEYWDGAEWKITANGTTIGYKRLLQFNTITTDWVRFRVLSSRLNPCLAELGLFYIKEPGLK